MKKTLTLEKYTLSARSFGSIVRASRAVRSPYVLHDGGPVRKGDGGQFLKRYVEDAYVTLEHRLISFRTWKDSVCEEEERYIVNLLTTFLKARRLWLEEYSKEKSRTLK